MNATAPPARLKLRYLDEIRPDLIGRFGYSSVMQAPKVEKVTLNMGVGSAKQDSKTLKAAQDQLATIAGQRPSVRRARKSIAAFKLRDGMPVGLAVTLRGERAYEFLDRLISIAIPRIRDFRGLNPRSFDGRGNYSLGVREQIIFPEIDYDAIDEVRGLDITITTTAATDPEAFALLFALGMPFARQGRPGAFDAVVDDDRDESSGAAGGTVPAASAVEEASAATDEPDAAAGPETIAEQAGDGPVALEDAEALEEIVALEDAEALEEIEEAVTIEETLAIEEEASPEEDEAIEETPADLATEEATSEEEPDQELVSDDVDVDVATVTDEEPAGDETSAAPEGEAADNDGPTASEDAVGEDTAETKDAD